MYDKRFMIDKPMRRADDPDWIEDQALVATWVARVAVDEADRLLLLEILGIAA
jgi:hypothetical protein